MPHLQRLSKSRFMLGQRCPLLLWNECFHPELAGPRDDARQSRIESGYLGGALAQQLFPGTLVEADYRHPEEALAETARLLQNHSVQVIHEAAFEFQGSFIRADILVRSEQAWDLIEVKTVLNIKANHQMDAAFQRWVIAGSGIPVGRTSLLVLNRNYRYPGGDHDPVNLFRLEEISQDMDALVSVIESDSARFQALLQEPEGPSVQPGSQCYDSYECPYLAHCTRDWPNVSDPVDWIPGFGPQTFMQLHAGGVHRMSDLPIERLNAKQAQVVDCHRESRPWVADNLDGVLKAFEWPIHFVDFETSAVAVPTLKGSGPYQAVPVQWSCHTLQQDGQLTHREFLADDISDPHEAFTLSLVEAVGGVGSIYVYSSFEGRILKDITRALPHLSDSIEPVVGRLLDLHRIVKSHVYLPAFCGSYSLKNVLPALVSGFDYRHLAIQDGRMAGDAFGRMLAERNVDIRQAMRNDLLAYCAQDTLAMVKIREALLQLC